MVTVRVERVTCKSNKPMMAGEGHDLYIDTNYSVKS